MRPLRFRQQVLLNVQVLWDVTLCRVARGLVGLLDPEDEGTTTVRTVENYWPDDTKLHLGRFHFPKTLSLKIPICGVHVNVFPATVYDACLLQSAVDRTEELVNHT